MTFLFLIVPFSSRALPPNPAILEPTESDTLALDPITEYQLYNYFLSDEYAERHPDLAKWFRCKGIGYLDERKISFKLIECKE